ncbi:hypothetical protein BDL97_15G015600 [Sphagnum fallax]|nr:hypothetical protein BDL97_15G015600 [Sphagnum fallax]
MFKKAVEVKGSQRLSGADRKKLRRNVREKFANAAEADIDLLLPPKAEVSVTKLANRVHLYSADGGPPILFDVDGRGNEIFPTVYGLWKVPNILPAFMLKGAEVSRYVLGGADLMFPGIDVHGQDLPMFAAGEPWSILVPGNPFPIAVGTTLLSSAEAIKAHLRGKALHVMHYYRDMLWETAEGRYVPNAGFLKDMVVEDPALMGALLDPAAAIDSTAQGSEASISEESCSNKMDEQEGIEGLQEGRAESNVEGVASSVQEGFVGQGMERINLNVSGGNEDGEEEVSGALVLTIEEMDALLDKCLLEALHVTVKDKDLPMPGSTLWLGHILACRPPGSVLDIKKSSHKKLSKWLQNKASTGLITAKEDKHRKEVFLTGVNRGHLDYQSYQPGKKSPLPEVASALPGGTVAAQSPSSEVEVGEVFRPTIHVIPVFEAVGVDPSKYYTAAEATGVVNEYVEKHNLIKKSDGSVVILDFTLCDALYKGTVKKGSTYPSEIHRRDLGSSFVGRMQAHHRVSRGAESVVRKGALKSVQIMTERRQGNKKVTRLTGIESFLVDADVLATELQKKFACSTSVTELPGKKGQSEVLVQGGVLEDLGKHLVQHYGIPKKHIEILDKTKKV